VKNKGKVLAIDLGQAHVGLALTDPEQVLVFGKGVLRGFKRLEEVFQAIKELCDKEHVVLVVMGLPLDEEGNSTQQSERIQRLGTKLQGFLENVPVEYVDESFTSFEAGEFLASRGVKGSNRKPHEDEMAAVQILERYLKHK
jgi:putative Holliday junction resolvase